MGRVLVLAGAAAAAAFAVARPTGRELRAAADHFRCPMHADVESTVPAACPICGMALVIDRATRATTAPPVDTAPVARVERRVISEAVRAPAWVEPDGGVVAIVYRDDLVGMSPDHPAVVYPATMPSLGVEVVLTADPATEWDSSTARVQLRAAHTQAGEATIGIGAHGAVLRPGDQGLLVIAGRPRELPVVPAGAVLQAQDGPYVLALDPVSRRFARRPVRLGRTNHGVTAVLSGVHEGESVVAVGTFFVDAELARTSRPGVAP